MDSIPLGEFWTVPLSSVPISKCGKKGRKEGLHSAANFTYHQHQMLYGGANASSHPPISVSLIQSIRPWGNGDDGAFSRV